MQLTENEFKLLILVVGLIIGVAISFLAYAGTHNYFAFIFVPICAGLVYYQIVHPFGKK